MPGRTIPLIPTRRCSLCQQPQDVVRMVLHRKAWVCTDCVRNQSHRRTRQKAHLREADAAAAAAAHSGVVPGGMPNLYLPALARTGVYGFLVLLASQSPAAMGLLTGCLLADMVTWAATIFLTAARGSGPVVAEAAVFMATGAAWTHLGDGMQLPAEANARATAMLVGMAVFGAKAIRFTTKLRHDGVL